MKNIFLILSAFLGLISGSANAQGNCQVPQALTTHYADDINALAVEYMLTTADSDQVTISPVCYNEIAEGMAAIFNSTLPERDSIFDLYCVHWPWGISLCKSYLIFFDSTYSWTQAWQNTQTVTGNPAIDNLFSTHSLYVDQYFSWSFGEAVLVESTINGLLNYDALFDSLMLVPGVISCESNALFGGAGYITYNKTANTRHYEFKFDWNDCFDGCDNARTWFFDVDTNCNVTFTGIVDWWVFSYEPLPQPLNCNITPTGIETKNRMNIYIFPNPVTDQLNFHLVNNDKALLKIYDASGLIIFSQNITSENSSVDFKKYPKGIYLAELNMNGRIVTKKIISQ